MYVKNTGQLETKNQKKGSDRPHNPPSKFGGVPKLYLSQTLVSPSRNIQKRKISCAHAAVAVKIVSP